MFICICWTDQEAMSPRMLGRNVDEQWLSQSG